MITNVGTMDRSIRLIVGAALVAVAVFSGWAIFDGAVMRYGAIVVGLILAGTGYMRTCPAYSIFGIRTCKT